MSEDTDLTVEQKEDKIVEPEMIKPGTLPPMRYRDMPKSVSWKKMVGPSIILAGMSLGSGEFVIWPAITYAEGFIFFWACILGVTTQYFLNLEIERWTLATGESAITGFCRISKAFVFLFLLFNFVPWIWPAWVNGAAELVGGTFLQEKIEDTESISIAVNDFSAEELSKLPKSLNYAPSNHTITWYGDMSPNQWAQIYYSLKPKDLEEKDAAEGEKQANPALLTYLEDSLLKKVQKRKQESRSKYIPVLGIAGLILIGVILTSGPVVYNTLEKTQMILVGLIFILSIIIGCFVITPEAIKDLCANAFSFRVTPTPGSGVTFIELLGAIAFAGAGGMLNLGQSNYIKDKGYGMGAYIGRITSPITGQEESDSEVGYHFPHTEENLARWKAWWKAANLEHFFSFFLTCLASLVLLSLITFSLLRDENGNKKVGSEVYDSSMGFIFAQADMIGQSESLGALGPTLKYAFLFMGITILMTTALGVLDGVSRIFADLFKTNFFLENKNWSLSRIYYIALWGMIAGCSSIFIIGVFVPTFSNSMFLFTNTSAMNGGVMAVYSALLLYMNYFVLPKDIRMSKLRALIMCWSTLFFGSFTVWAIQDLASKL